MRIYIQMLLGLLKLIQPYEKSTYHYLDYWGGRLVVEYTEFIRTV